MANEKLKAVVLAAGKGTRLHSKDSDAPKVMRTACGKPLLWFVLETLSFIEKKDTIIVVGYKKDDVIGAFGDYPHAVQEEQLGTGHAVMAAAGHLSEFGGSVLVCYGDMPAITRERYEGLFREHFEQGNDCTILTGESESGLPYGRVIRDESGGFVEVVEEKDCTPGQLEIKELNSGVYMFRARPLLEALKKLKRDNSQGEYYLTDAPAIMRSEGAKIGIYRCDMGDEMVGVNTKEQLEQMETILRNR